MLADSLSRHEGNSMTVHRWAGLLSLAMLAACANSQGIHPDFAARNRPLEERCARVQKADPGVQPGETRADVQKRAQEAAARGELDGACNWL
jgi:hypothetical protein